MKKEKKDIYKSKPWRDQEEYFALVDEYDRKFFGDELAKVVKQDRKRVRIPLPNILKGGELI